MIEICFMVNGCLFVLIEMLFKQVVEKIEFLVNILMGLQVYVIDLGNVLEDMIVFVVWVLIDNKLILVLYMVVC